MRQPISKLDTHALSLTPCPHYPPHVPDPAEEVVGAVPECDEGVRAEEDRLRSVGRLRELGEHDARHTRLGKLQIACTNIYTWDMGISLYLLDTADN